MTNIEGQYTIKIIGLRLPYIFYDNNVFASFSKRKEGEMEGKEGGVEGGRNDSFLASVNAEKKGP